jgi:hypothetical protein
MERVAQNLERSLAQHPRPLTVVYLLPRWAEVLDRLPSLQRVTLAPALTTPAAARRFRELRSHEHGNDLPVVVYRYATS